MVLMENRVRTAGGVGVMKNDKNVYGCDEETCVGVMKKRVWV